MSEQTLAELVKGFRTRNKLDTVAMSKKAHVSIALIYKAERDQVGRLIEEYNRLSKKRKKRRLEALSISLSRLVKACDANEKEWMSKLGLPFREDFETVSLIKPVKWKVQEILDFTLSSDEITFLLAISDTLSKPMNLSQVMEWVVTKRKNA